jgi:hypothetical protein
MLGVQHFTSGRTSCQLLHFVGGNVFENYVIDGHSQRAIASAQATHVLDLRILRPDCPEALCQFRTQFASAVQTTAQVGADANFRAGWGDR